MKLYLASAFLLSLYAILTWAASAWVARLYEQVNDALGGI